MLQISMHVKILVDIKPSHLSSGGGGWSEVKCKELWDDRMHVERSKVLIKIK